MNAREVGTSAVSWSARAQAVADQIRSTCPITPRVGVVLGSGLGGMADRVEDATAFSHDSLPDFPRATATGHVGSLVLGELAGVPLIALQGRFHFYEGYSPADVTLPIEVMRALGAEVVILSNASGGLNPNFRSGDIMAIEDHIDMMFFRLALTPAPVFGRQPATGPIYDAALLERALVAGRRAGFPVHRGVYAGLRGPNYETRAEYRLLRRVGVDVVGMSTVSEAVAAHALGMRVLAFSTVTNVAKPDALVATGGEEVVAIAEDVEPRLTALVCEIIRDLDP